MNAEPTKAESLVATFGELVDWAEMHIHLALLKGDFRGGVVDALNMAISWAAERAAEKVKPEEVKG